MKHKALVFGFFVALCAAAPLVAAADKRTVVTLRGTTVADILCSEHDGHVGFNMPLAPAFVRQPNVLMRLIFGSTPDLVRYPALYQTQTGTLSTSAMIRFILASPTLFTNNVERSAYEKSMQHCIEAHKTWYAKQSSENLKKLHIAEDIVFLKLRRLSIQNPKLRTKLEKILSSPLKNKFTRMSNSLVASSREYFLQKEEKCPQTKSPVIKRNEQSSIVLHALKMQWPLFALFAINPICSKDCNAHIYAPLLCAAAVWEVALVATIPMSSNLEDVLEPEEGIKIIVETGN